MLSVGERRGIARVYAVAAVLYGVALLVVGFLINVVVGGARFEVPTIAIAGGVMLLLAPAIWRGLAPAMIAAFVAGVIAWFAFGRPMIFLGAFIVVPLIFGMFTALCLWPGPKRT
jgi:hypothetical protein